MGTAVALLLVALLLLLSLQVSRTPVRSKAWQLLRVLLPSWRFFEDIELGPQLWLRVRSGEPTWSDWRLALPPSRRRAGSLLLDAEGNFTLAQQSVVEQLWSELDGLELTVAPSLVSYQLVQLIVERHAREHTAPLPDTHYQFCLSEGAADDEAARFVSPEHLLRA